MQISLNNNTNPSFGIIELKPRHKRMSEKLMNSMITYKSSTEEKNKFALKLYKLFEPYIKEEGELKAKTRYPIEDVISDIKVRFWEFIYKINSNSTIDDLIKQINEFKPFKSSLKPEADNYSLDVWIPGQNKCYVDNVTKENLPIPQTEVERAEIKQKLKTSVQKTKMTPQTKRRLSQRGKGLKYSEIATNEKVSKSAIVNSVKRGILQVQHRTDNISKENKQHIFNLAQVLGITYNQALEIALKHVEILSITSERLNFNIETIAKLLGISREEFIKLGLKNPTLFYRKPEALNENVEKCSELFRIPRTISIKLGQRIPTLLTRKPETLYSNGETAAKLFGISMADFIKIALKEPAILNKKPETSNANVEASSKLLGILKKEFIKAAILHPPLFYQKPETINTNIEVSAKQFGIKKDEFVKAALQRPTLFSRNPETLYENVKLSARMLGIPIPDFVKIALRQPALFYLKAETINENIESSAILLGVSKNELLESAKKSPQIFYMKPETLKMKSKIVSYYRKLKNNPNDLKLTTYITKSESQLYKEILFYLIGNNKNFENLKKSQIEAKLQEFADSCKEPLDFVIPKSEFIQNFIKFSQDYSVKATGKNIFKFIVYEQSV